MEPYISLSEYPKVAPSVINAPCNLFPLSVGRLSEVFPTNQIWQRCWDVFLVEGISCWLWWNKLKSWVAHVIRNWRLPPKQVGIEALSPKVLKKLNYVNLEVDLSPAEPSDKIPALVNNWLQPCKRPWNPSKQYPTESIWSYPLVAGGYAMKDN